MDDSQVLEKPSWAVKLSKGFKKTYISTGPRKNLQFQVCKYSKKNEEEPLWLGYLDSVRARVRGRSGTKSQEEAYLKFNQAEENIKVNIHHLYKCS